MVLIGRWQYHLLQFKYKNVKSKINIIWINARENINNFSTKIDAILVPGGFGKDGTEGKIVYAKLVHKIHRKNL